MPQADAKYTIAIDAMGGDGAPQIVMDGLGLIAGELEKKRISLLIFGPGETLAPLVAKRPALVRISKIVDARDVVSGEDKPSRVIRSGRDTSMWRAIEAVREHKADAVVSAGNTGCLMGISKLLIKMIEGITRPAITTLVPNEKGGLTTMLDLGANAECDEFNIAQFAVIGSLYSRLVAGVRKPKVGILNIGSESGKGPEYLGRAAELVAADASKLDFEYIGFVEGDDIFKGKADVIAADGFSGNIALKTLEGTAKFIAGMIRKLFKGSLLGAISYLLLRGRINEFRKTADPRNYNGAVFLGLDGIVVKSHGGTDAKGYASAVNYASVMVAHDFNAALKRALAKKGAAK